MNFAYLFFPFTGYYANFKASKGSNDRFFIRAMCICINLQSYLFCKCFWTALAQLTATQVQRAKIIKQHRRFDMQSSRQIFAQYWAPFAENCLRNFLMPLPTPVGCVNERTLSIRIERTNKSTTYRGTAMNTRAEISLTTGVLTCYKLKLEANRY